MFARIVGFIAVGILFSGCGSASAPPELLFDNSKSTARICKPSATLSFTSESNRTFIMTSFAVKRGGVFGLTDYIDGKGRHDVALSLKNIEKMRRPCDKISVTLVELKCRDMESGLRLGCKQAIVSGSEIFKSFDVEISDHDTKTVIKG